jgi:aromatic ring-opening dioxygenase LigB subunit
MPVLNINLEFRKKYWIINLNQKELRAESIEELKIRLEEVLKKLYPNQKVKVIVSYNWKNLPHWLWQYQSYYFNRVWEFDFK